MRRTLAHGVLAVLLLGGGLAWPGQPAARTLGHRVVLAEMFTATW